MRTVFLFSISLFFLFAMDSCTKSTNNDAALCNNGIKDGKETEIDCNGDCAPCAGVPALSCTMGGTPYICSNVRGQTLNPSIRIYGTDQGGRPMNFMFLPGPINQPLPIIDVTLSFDGEPYTYGVHDTGSVTITSIDTLRKVVSGSFGFSARRVTKNTSVAIQSGVFTNVRYGNGK